MLADIPLVRPFLCLLQDAVGNCVQGESLRGTNYPGGTQLTLSSVPRTGLDAPDRLSKRRGCAPPAVNEG